MENFTPQVLSDIWKKGKTLEEAIFIFCDSKYIEAYEKLDLNEDEFETGENSGWNALLNSLQKGTRNLLKIQHARDDLYDNLYRKLKNGDLTAIGYEAPVKTSDFPIIIPLHMWPPHEANKSKSSISGNGLNFLSVRIVKNSELGREKQPKEINFPQIKPQNKKIGRPSLKKEIIAVYIELKKRKKIDYSKTLKSHTELIQESIHVLFPEIKDTAGMEHEAIRRAIGQAFKQDKETSKSTSKL